MASFINLINIKKNFIVKALVVFMFCMPTKALTNASLNYEAHKLYSEMNGIQLEILNLESQIETLEIRQNNHLEKISNFYSDLYKNVVILYKLKIIPLTSFLYSNITPSEIALMYTVSNFYYNFLVEQIIDYQDTVQQMKKNEQEIRYIRNQIIKNNASLKANQKAMFKLIRNKQYSKASSISSQNKTILAKKEEIIKRAYFLSENLLNAREKKLDSEFSANKGSLEWPVNGFVDHEAKNNSLYKTGVLIMTQPSSTIKAPFSGKIIHIGSLEGVGSIIIIQHSPSYHSIITGEFESKVFSSQIVSTGENIAISNDIVSATYFEIKSKSSFLNPTPWMKTKSPISSYEN